ncbi:MAG: chemotaxis protein [Acidobacteria bacterium]|nr:MAG: chemotaxis protein [Acidobacteriota bacterium]
MLLLKFQVGSSLFAVDSKQVLEVTPWVNLRPIPLAAPYIKGLFHYRGKVVPVVDLAGLMGAAACQPRLSTRIIVIERSAAGAERSLMGLLAERVTDLVKVADNQFMPPSGAMNNVSFLGPFVETESGLVQLILVDQVVPEALDRALTGSTVERP